MTKPKHTTNKIKNFFIFLIALIFCIPLFAKDFTLFTQPKTGTHLLIPILQSLTGKKVYWAPEFKNQTEDTEQFNVQDLENPFSFVFAIRKAPWEKTTMDQVWEITKQKKAFLHLHPPYSRTMEHYLSQHNCINFFIARDPRDCIVSLLNHQKHIQENKEILNRFPSDNDRLLFLIENRLREITLAYKGWLQSPTCCVLHFHKLMGFQGGAATDQEAINELKKMTNALNLRVTEADLFRIYKQHFGKGWSFFRSKVGSWKEYFTETHRIAAKKAIADLLIELGYEQDDLW